MFLLLARVIYLIIFAPKSLQDKVKFVNKIIHNTRGCYQVVVNDNKLVVLGAGWLGEALCLKANELGWQVQGTGREVKHDTLQMGPCSREYWKVRVRDCWAESIIISGCENL